MPLLVQPIITTSGINIHFCAKVWGLLLKSLWLKRFAFLNAHQSSIVMIRLSIAGEVGSLFIIQGTAYDSMQPSFFALSGSRPLHTQHRLLQPAVRLN